MRVVARATLFVVLVLLSGVVLTACLPAAEPWSAPAASGQGNVHHVGVIGDSLVHQAQHVLRAHQRLHRRDELGTKRYGTAL